MGLFLTLFYILTAYLSPSSIFPALAEYRIEIVIAAFTLIGSLFASQKPPLFKMSQVYVLLGLVLATFLSIASTGWIGGGQGAVLDFMPIFFAFIFIVLNCRTKRHVQFVMIMLLAVSVFVILMGSIAFATGDAESPYLLSMGNGTDKFFRLRGLGFINDPNDFGQLIVSLMPCLFFFWKPKRAFFNSVFVLIPAAILIYGTFLTHSRGAMIALLVVIAIAARRKIGTIPSAVIASALFAAMTAIGWSGNREVSVEAGADRMGAWSAGLEMIKQYPIFGVGYGNYGEHYILTAHNTIVVCLAELGVVGLFFWLLFVCSAFWEVMTVASSGEAKVEIFKEAVVAPPIGVGPVAWIRSTVGMPKIAIAAPHQMSVAVSGPRDLSFGAVKLNYAMVTEEEVKAAADEDIRRLGRVMILSLAGFLAAGWFLSRAFQMTLFIYCGMAEVVYQIALGRNMVPARLPLKRLSWISVVVGIFLVAVVYVVLRISHSMGIVS